MKELKDKTVFICPLDWGLGHATRCVALIKALIQNNNRIIIGITPLTKPLFESEFPGLEKIPVPAYNIKYSRLFPLWMKLLFDWNRITAVIKQERRELAGIVSLYNIDVVISDSRFGMRATNCRNIFITHQMFIKAPFLSGLAQRINKQYLLQFDELWVPDFQDENESLSAELSHGKQFHKQVRYIGPLSRLHKAAADEKYDYLFLISGPEPQSTLLKKMLMQKSMQYPSLRFALVAPSPGATTAGNLDCFVLPGPQKLSELIAASKRVVCRSGYSSLMDLFVLRKKDLVLVPTPGQTEQEYLADYWEKKYGSVTINQKHLKAFRL